LRRASAGSSFPGDEDAPIALRIRLARLRRHCGAGGVHHPAVSLIREERAPRRFAPERRPACASASRWRWRTTSRQRQDRSRIDVVNARAFARVGWRDDW